MLAYQTRLIFRAQNLIALRPGASLRRITKLCCMAPITRRSNPQDLADRLTPEGVTMLIDKGL